MVAVASVESPLDPPRVGYSVGRRAAGGAVTRNRVRRRLRAATRAHAAELLPGHAYVVTALSGAARAPYADLDHSLSDCLRALREDQP